MSPEAEIADLKAQLERARELITAILRKAGEPGYCHGCSQKITLLRHIRSGKPTAYDADGRMHFTTCPQTDKPRRLRASPPTKEGEENA